MNNSIKTSTLELREALLNEEAVKEYLRLKALLESNDELKKMRDRIASLYASKQFEEHKKLKEEYENVPLVKNVYSLKEEVMNLLKEIKEILDV